MALLNLMVIVRAQGQGSKELQAADSLKFLLEQTQVDSQKVAIITQLARLYGAGDKEKSIEYYKKALTHDLDSADRARYLNTIGFYYWGLGKFTEAIEFYNQSLTLYKALDDSTYMGIVVNNIATSKWALGQWNDALQIYQKGLKIRQAVNDRKGVSLILNNIGLIYQDFGVYDEALTYHYKGLEIAREIDNINTITYSYSNIGSCYKLKKEFKSALKYYKLGHKIYDENKNNGRNYSYFLANIGMAYFELGKTDSALHYFEQSLKQAERIHNEHRVAIAEYHLGIAHLHLGNIETAAGFIHKSYQHALENQYLELLRDNQFALAEIEEARGHANVALEYYKNAAALKDSLFNKEEISKFAELIIKQIQEKEENEKALLKENIEIQKVIIREERIILWMLVAGGVLLLAALFHIARSRESIKKLNAKLRESERGLKQSNADKDKLFTIIAHDLRSPFNTIMGFSKILAQHAKKKDVDNIEEYSKIINKSSENAMALLSNLMEWSLSKTDQMIFNPKELDVNDLINKNVRFHTATAKQKSITITNLTKGSLLVSADPSMVDTVIRNLISNAIKFTSSGGSIQVWGENKKENVEIAVRDNGLGMKEEALQKLFRADTQYSTYGTQNEKGTGLGLMLCKEFIEKHNGQIWVQSEVGKGSVFYFHLPI